jgi:hypothetical protein
VYAITRETTGLAWGMGWEHFTPPASAYAFGDTVALVRIDVDTGAITTLERWSSTPVTRRVMQNYRGRIFSFLSVTIRAHRDGRVEYAAAISIPRVPSSEVHLLSGVWAPSAAPRGEWVIGERPMGASEPVVAGETEVLALRGPESYACLVLVDHAATAPRALAWPPGCRKQYPDGPPLAAVMEASRKKDLDRLAEIGRLRAERIATYRAEGRPEGEALLQSSRDLQGLGYLPKPAQVVAWRVEADMSSALPVFEIADAEMASGVFPDLQRALGSPGAEVEKSMGRYVVHRDYTNSARLNAFVDGGGREFLVRFRGATYRVEIRPGTPP